MNSPLSNALSRTFSKERVEVVRHQIIAIPVYKEVNKTTKVLKFLKTTIML